MTDQTVPQNATPDNEADDLALYAITVVRQPRGSKVGKFFDYVNGELVKGNRPPLHQGLCETRYPRTLDDMMRLLEEVTADPVTTLMAGSFIGHEGGPFKLTTRKRLAEMEGRPAGELPTPGVLVIDGERWAARSAASVVRSGWVMLDFDKPAFMPTAWRDADIDDVLVLLDPIIPVARTAFVEARSSGGRCVGPGRADQGNRHLWFHTLQPERIDRLRTWLHVNSAALGLTFVNPAKPADAPSLLVDTITLNRSQPIYCNAPEITPAAVAAGYSDDGAAVGIMDTGPDDLPLALHLDLTMIAVPDRALLDAVRERTGRVIGIDGDMLTDESTLTYETAIESAHFPGGRGRMTFRDTLEWLGTLPRTDPRLHHFRCEAMFRSDSVARRSENAAIHRIGDHEGVLVDFHGGTVYRLAPDIVTAACHETYAAFTERWLAVVGVDRSLAIVTAWREHGVAMTALRAARAVDTRPVIDVSGDDEHGELEKALTHLDKIEPKMFWRGQSAVHVSREVPLQIFDPTTGDRVTVKVRGVEEVTAKGLAPKFAKVIRFTKTSYREVRDPPRTGPASIRKTIKTVHAPPRLMDAVLSDETLPMLLPPLAGIASAPIMDAQTGEARTNPGYDPASGFWIDDAVDVTIPETPTKADAAAALKVLLELTVGFPFVEKLDKSVYLAAMLTAAARPMFDKVPGVLVLAPAPGSGKSHLTKVLGALMTGAVPTLTGWPLKEEEFIKHFDAMLLKGVSFIAYDNVNNAVIGNDRLNSVMTETSVSIRPLGATDNVPVSTAGVLLVVNGNNSEPHADATQRFLATNIDPMMENGRERTFARDPLAMVLADRGHYLGAALTILRAYIKAGRLDARGYGSFDLWSRTVRSALIWLGRRDPLDSITAGVAADPEREKRALVLGFMRQVFGDALFTVADVMREAAGVVHVNVLNAAGVDVLPGVPGKPAKQWGYYLKSIHHHVVTLPEAGPAVRLHLDPVRGIGSAKRWRVQIMRPALPGGGAGV